MTLSPWVLLAAVAGCCGLMLGEVGAVAVAPDSSTPSAFAKHYLGATSSRGFDHAGKDTSDTSDDTMDAIHRRLQTSACGDEIGRVSQAEMKALASTLLTYLLTQFGALNLLENTLNYFASSLRYDVVAYKVCGSCAQAQAMLSDEAVVQDESVFGAFASYCGTDKYGSDAQHSALVFVPVTTTDTTGDLTKATIAEGSLRSFVNMHLTQTSVSGAPTEIWPANLTKVLTFEEGASNVEEVLVNFIDYLAPLVAGGSGAVTVIPDYIGFGASLTTHNRTYGFPPTYMQAAVTSWMATKQAIEEDTYGWSIKEGTAGCTVMDAVVSVAGVSEGGMASIAAGPALQQAGVRVLSINSGAAPLDPGQGTESVIESFDNGLVSLQTDSASYYSILPFIAYAFSVENPGLANTGTDQQALAPEWRNATNFDRDIISWFESPGLLTSREVAQRMLPIDVTSVFNADYLALLRQARAAGVSFACDSEFVVVNVTDKLCEAVNSVSLLNVVADIDIPLQLCYSLNDTVVSPLVYTDSSINITGNPNVTFYAGPLGLLPVAGDHFAAVTLCSVGPLERFLNVDAADRPNLLSPLMGDQAAMCALSKSQATVPSSAPTPATSGATIRMVATSSGIAAALAGALLSLLSMF